MPFGPTRLQNRVWPSVRSKIDSNSVELKKTWKLFWMFGKPSRPMPRLSRTGEDAPSQPAMYAAVIVRVVFATRSTHLRLDAVCGLAESFRAACDDAA